MIRTLAWFGLVLVACSGSTGSGMNTNDLGVGADQGTLCPSFTPIKVSPQTSFAPATLTASAVLQTSDAFTWTVTGPSGPLKPQALDGSGLFISVDAPDPGTYTFSLYVYNGCPGTASAIVTAPNGVVQPYRLRLTPPATSGYPQQDAFVTTVGNTPLSAAIVTLVSGTSFTGTLRGPAGAIEGQVALSPQSGPPILAQVGATGAFSLPYRLDGTYQLVLLPLDAALAPRLIGPLLGSTLATSTFTVDAGVTVSGAVRDPSLQPLAGATVALRQGALPSGLGLARSDGSYAMQAEPGTYDLAVSATGWPDLFLSGVGITTATSLGVDLTMTRVAVTLKVVGLDGVTPVAGAKVTLGSAPIAGAATVHTTSGDRTATGKLHLEATTAADGSLALLLPAAAYDVLVESSQGITGRHVIVSAAGPQQVALATSAQLSGHIVDWQGAPVASARVRAHQSAGTAVEVVTGSDGTYAFSSGLAAGLAVTLEVAPPLDVALAGTTRVLGDPTQLGVAFAPVADVTLPRGLQLAGTIVAPNVGVVGGVSIDVLCASCSDPTPLYHTDTSAAGTYTLYLPDPGVLDLGVTAEDAGGDLK